MHPVLSIVAALAPSHQCAPSVAPNTTVSIAKAAALTVHDNTSRMPCAPYTHCAVLAANLIVAHHHNVDLGVMQVNSANLAAVSPSVADAFDACGSMRAGSGIFSQAYHPALRAAVPMCNTGNSIRGMINGYVADVEAAERAVPSIVAFAPAGPAHADPTHDVTASAGAWNIVAEGIFVTGAVRWHAESLK